MNPEQIKKLRGSLGLDQTQFALLVGVKRTTICAWENGHPPRPRNIAKLMELLDKKWVGLTDEDMDESHNFDFIHGARWAEARLKERNT